MTSCCQPGLRSTSEDIIRVQGPDLKTTVAVELHCCLVAGRGEVSCFKWLWFECGPMRAARGAWERGQQLPTVACPGAGSHSLANQAPAVSLCSANVR